MYSSAILSFLMSIILDNFRQNRSLTLSNRLSLKMLLPSFPLMHFLSYDVASFGVYFNHGGVLFYSDACVQTLCTQCKRDSVVQNWADESWAKPKAIYLP